MYSKTKKLVKSLQGIVDSAYRYFRLTLRQAEQRWPDTLPKDLKAKMKNDPDEEFFFIHCVQPRKNFDPQRLDGEGLPFESVYVSEHDQTVLEEGTPGHLSHSWVPGRKPERHEQGREQ